MTDTPWTIEYDNYGNGSFHEWYSVGPARVDFVGSGEQAEQTALKHATLIAAAPDLLAALDRITKYCDSRETQGMTHGEIMRRVNKIARAAISKSTMSNS